MRRDEYEQRRQRLETQLREGIALPESAHRQQIRALELVWMTTAEEDLTLPAEPFAARSEPSPPVSAPAAPHRSRRRGPGELEEEVDSALTRVPEVFDRNDICRMLGYEPNRGSLYRILQELVREGSLAVQESGSGQSPTRYRKTSTASPPPGA